MLSVCSADAVSIFDFNSERLRKRKQIIIEKDIECTDIKLTPNYMKKK